MADEVGAGTSGVTVTREPGQPATGGSPDIRTVLLVIIAVAVAAWALRAAAVVAVPLVASILIALAVMPVRDRVRRRMPPRFRWVGVVAAMALLLLVTGLFFGALWLAIQQVTTELPGKDEIAQVIGQGADDAAGSASAQAVPPLGPPPVPAAAPAVATGTADPAPALSSAGDPSEGTVRDLADRFSSSVMGVLGKIGGTVLDSATSIVSGLVVIFFLTLLILVESDDWRRKLASISHPWTQWRLTESAAVIAHKVRVYLLVRAALGFATALLYGLWLWLFGAGLLVVWAILTFLLNFVPTIGSIIAGLLPTVYVFLTHDFGTAVAVGVGLLIIEQVMGNYVDPLVAGRRVAVSPLVVLVALLVWTWIWGIPGALLAVPVTVALVVLGAHVPVLRPWALLLSDRTDMEGLNRATRPR